MLSNSVQQMCIFVLLIYYCHDALAVFYEERILGEEWWKRRIRKTTSWCEKFAEDENREATALRVLLR